MNSEAVGGTILMGLLFLIAVAIYFIPTFVANVRKHHNVDAITMLNLFLGWTFIGWVGALVWAMTSPPPRP